LADRFEVSTRTIERDLDGLLQAGAPLYTHAGRTGGWVLDKAATFAAPALDAAEVTALAVAVARLADTPFAEAGRSAMSKIAGSLDDARRRDVAQLSPMVGLMNCSDDDVQSIPRDVQWALRHRRVIRLQYIDAAETTSVRDVEPVGLLGGHSWYLVAWCRHRQQMRTFRMDRICATEVLPESVRPRDVDLSDFARGYPLDVRDAGGADPRR
jgi:predicted DNA-binding transcriptional regulator YafY